tara:strand:+ start:265 stop:507 length:243 start_codon:yes stop_codon:yes gene_type:complete
MAISDIISFGFGNGTFDPGVNKLPTLGYSISSVTIVLGPFCVSAQQMFDAGAVVTESFVAGATEAEVFQAGAVVTQPGCG